MKKVLRDAGGEKIEMEVTEAESIANSKGWSLYSVTPTSRGLKSYEYRSIPGGGFVRTIPAHSEIEAAKALTRPRK